MKTARALFVFLLFTSPLFLQAAAPSPDSVRLRVSAAFAARTSDLSSRAYPNFDTDVQLDLAVDHFISGLRDVSSRDYLRRERVRRQIKWQEAIQMAQACEIPRAAEYQPPAAAACTDAISNAKSPNFAHSTSTSNDCAIAAQGLVGNSGNPRARGKHAKSRAPTVYPHYDATTSQFLRRRYHLCRKVDGLSTPTTAPLCTLSWISVCRDHSGFRPLHGTRTLDDVATVRPKSLSVRAATAVQSVRGSAHVAFSKSASAVTVPSRRLAVSPAFSYPATSSGNFPPSLPLTYDSQQSRQQQSNRSSSTVNAVNSAGRGAPQLFADVTFNWQRHQSCAHRHWRHILNDSDRRYERFARYPLQLRIFSRRPRISLASVAHAQQFADTSTPLSSSLVRTSSTH